ncbi:MAG: tetratricopeptide repeat protein [Acidobacteriota bacterium]|nr:tetratricopeptide repeat protein [Acidobacteriota bacterium]
MQLRFLLALFLVAPLLASVDEIRQLLQAGQFREALAASDRDLKTNGGDARIWTLRAMASAGLGQTASATKDLQRALHLQPKFMPALQNLAQIQYQSGDPQCEKTVEQIVALRPDDPVAHGMLGALAMERQDCKRGLAEYKQAGPAADNDVVRWQSGTCYFQDENWSAAAAEFSALLAKRDNDALRFNLALTQLRSSKAADAIETLRPLASKPEVDTEALSLLASAYEANKQTPEALHTLQTAIVKSPQDEQLYTELAAECLDHNAVLLGVDVLKAGALTLPHSARIQTMLGVLEARAGQPAAAKKSFDKASQLAPDAPLASVALAVMLMQQGSADQAVQVLGDELRRVPESIPAQLTLAQALLQRSHSRQDLAKAEALLKKVLHQNAHEERAYTTLGKIYTDRADYASARIALEKALSLDSTDSTATYLLMTTYRHLGREEDANHLATKVREFLAKEKTDEQESGRYTLIRMPEAQRHQ